MEEVEKRRRGGLGELGKTLVRERDERVVKGGGSVSL
jgi:hypothetical protein